MLKGTISCFQQMLSETPVARMLAPLSLCFSPLAVSLLSLAFQSKNVPTQVGAKDKLWEGGVSYLHTSKDDSLGWSL